MTERVLSVTGHRPSKLGNEYDYIGPYSSYLYSEFEKILIEKQPIDKLITGMALGFDTIACQVAIKLNIPVLAAVPFLGQERKWPKKSQDLYNHLLNHPLVTTRVVCKGGYNSAKMQIRNEYMVNGSNIIICCWDGTTGGTMNCVRYAEKKKDIELIFINPDGWRKKEAPEQPGLF